MGAYGGLSHSDHHPSQPHFALCQTFTEESGYIPGKFSSVTYTYSLLAEIPVSASLALCLQGKDTLSDEMRDFYS